MKTKKALLVIDIQNDFLENGSLEVSGSNSIIPIVNKLTKGGNFDLIIFTKDWHPHNHKSFASQHDDKNTFDVINLNGIQQVLWPDHCVQDTQGAEFHKDLNIDVPNMYIFKKGMNINIDSYSGFYENDHKTSTGLTDFLKERDIKETYICGLALDFCILYTSLDSINDGFQTNLILDGTRSISDEGGQVSIEKMIKNKIKIIESKNIL